MKALAGFSPIARGLIVAAAIAVLVLFVQAAAAVLAPMLLAVFIAIVATPPLRWMRAKGVPKYLALAVILFVLLDIGSLIALVATGALEGLREGLPTYQERLILLAEELGNWLEGLGMEKSKEAVIDLSNPAAASTLVRALIARASDAFGTGLLVFLAVCFILLEAPALSNKLKAAFHLGADAEHRLRRIFESINKYMMIKSLTSLLTALIIFGWLWYLGIEFAVLWAILAFALNFVPFVGAVLMAIPALLMALIQTDLSTTLLVAAGYVVVNTVIGNVLEPRIMGRGLGISTLAVFVSLLFWGWVLGTIGVFLSVPLTMTLLIAMDASAQTRAMAILLGPTLADPGVAEDAGQDAGAIRAAADAGDRGGSADHR